MWWRQGTMLQLGRPRLPLRKPLPIIVQPVRYYHYDKDIFGFRTPRPFELPPYTADELLNRNENSKLLRLVRSFRTHGHRVADLDPLQLSTKDHVPELDPAFFGLTTAEQHYNLAGILHVSHKSDPNLSREKARLETIVDTLKKTYAGRIGFEFEHIPNSSERRWLARLIESYERRPFTKEEKLKIFELLTKSEVFDHFMAKKFPQVKRYGLEGAESMMVALDNLFQVSNKGKEVGHDSFLGGIRDIVLCMPHRGRLNLLTGLLKYSPAQLFHKVKGNPEFPPNVPGIGDVLSHLATSVDLDYSAPKPIHVSLLHNPSHLEAVNPVAMGKARARQMYLYDQGSETPDCMLGDRVMCVQLHGDAAFTGQGVVTETLGLSNLPHFTSGGSIHVIVNNQIGYTTPAMNARSTVYTSDVAKMINAPVIHVNADHPEDVIHAIQIAFEYRHQFRKDVILDLIAYRRWGHNELDEPAFTQPSMYKNIRSRKSVPVLYEEQLISEGFLTTKEIDTVRSAYFKELEAELQASYTYQPQLDSLQGKWSKMTVATSVDNATKTGVDVDTLKLVGTKSVEYPNNFTVHPRLQKYHIENRVNKVQQGVNLDWATAEAMAFGSLLLDGFNVRISGQDVGRGTFSQRHVMLVDQETERTIIPLNRLTRKQPDVKQGMLEIANSSLSEFAVLGFETGVSWETPNRLCIWEAQFGDFFNGAQIIIDTYLASGESKWFRQSGLIMLLPHGYDGAGPEHSSCRIERFLQLCDSKFNVLDTTPDNPNMHVVYPTTPAQYFHLLRRQVSCFLLYLQEMLRKYRKPMIVVGPKILLRHPQAVSSLQEMTTDTSFKPVLGDDAIQNPSTVQRVIFMSGKLYYDLVKKRADVKKQDSVAIIRLEELAPFPTEALQAEIAKYPQAQEFAWVQEEPQNQGAFTFVEPRLSQLLPSQHKLEYVGRMPLAAPAVGVSSRHKVEQEALLKAAFSL